VSTNETVLINKLSTQLF